MPSAPMWKLRRLAVRAKRVLERRKAEAPALLAYEPTLVPAADAFMTTYDAAARFETKWRKEMDEGRSAIQELATAMRGWMPLLVRDVPGFEGIVVSTAAVVPDDMIEEAERLLAMLADHVSAAGTPLPYQQLAFTEVDGKLRAAQKEWAEAEAADSAYQQQLAEVRTTAAQLDLELQAFRRTLGVLIGRSDKDYQKLRSQRAAQRDDEDDIGLPVPPEQVPAASKSATPRARA